MLGEPLRIRAEPSLHDGDTCKFVLDDVLHSGPPLHCTRDHATDAPLATRLFAVEGVTQILIDGTTLTVSKAPQARWAELAPYIGAALRAHVQSGAAAVSLVPSLDDAAVAKRVTEVLEQEVNPRVESHGGSISLVDVKDGVVYVSMSGGCQGCGAAKITLARGVETSIRQAVPQVKKIIDVTDHQAGQRPYYQPT